MAQQVTKMVIKVDLQCCRCYKKIKKILYEIPQVTNQIFNEKQNTVTITVVCCSPEKVRQKICRKGRDIICRIDIIPHKPDPKDKSTQTKDPDTKDQSTQTAEIGPGEQQGCRPTVIGYPSLYLMGQVYVCPPCHNRGCGWFCPCNCHCGRPPMCDEGFGRQPMCPDGCGSPAHECRCWRPSHLRCCDRCNDGNASSSCTPHSCDGGRPPVCTDAGYECETFWSLL